MLIKNIFKSIGKFFEFIFNPFAVMFSLKSTNSSSFFNDFRGKRVLIFLITILLVVGILILVYMDFLFGVSYVKC